MPTLVRGNSWWFLIFLRLMQPHRSLGFAEQDGLYDDLFTADGHERI